MKNSQQALTLLIIGIIISTIAIYVYTQLEIKDGFKGFFFGTGMGLIVVAIIKGRKAAKSGA